MRKLFAVAVRFITGLVFGLYLRGGSQTAHAGAGDTGGGAPTCSAKNGDVNADGKLDLSDPLTILGHLFLGNPAALAPNCDPPELPARIQELEALLASTQADLTACQDDLQTSTEASGALTAQVNQLLALLADCRAGSAAGLPDTGLTKCYDQSGSEISCDSATCRGQDGHYATGCPSKGRFVDNDDGTVMDTCTDLIWLQNTVDVNGDGQITTDGTDVLSWCEALAYCENLSFASHDDWRLPNVRELQSLVDYWEIAPSIDPVFGALSEFYWSSTSSAVFPDLAWYVSFHGAFLNISDDKDFGNYVRAVRGRP